MKTLKVEKIYDSNRNKGDKVFIREGDSPDYKLKSLNILLVKWEAK